MIRSSGYVIGSEDSADTLTAAYAGNASTFPVGGKYQLQLYVEYTPAANNRTLSIQMEFSPDQSDFYKVVMTSLDSSGTETITVREPQKFLGATADTTYKVRVSEPVADSHCRISVKEDGSSDFGSVTLRYRAVGE